MKHIYGYGVTESALLQRRAAQGCYHVMLGPTTPLHKISRGKEIKETKFTPYDIPFCKICQRLLKESEPENNKEKEVTYQITLTIKKI